MARAIWSGSISFGLVNIPIKLYTAVSRKNVSFHQVDAKTGSRVRMKRVSSGDEGREVPYEEIVKGYEMSPDRYVLVTPEELESLDPEASRTIDIEAFVDLAEIDPVFYDSAYYVAPTRAAEKPYALLVQAMEEEGKVAIARFVMRTKQYLAALRPKEGKLLLSTMVYADELVPAKEIGELESLDDIEVSERELTMAKQLIASLEEEFDPGRFRDEYRERVLDLIERKAAGETVSIETPAPAETGVVDLMAALEASVREARQSRKRHPATASPEGSSGEAGTENGAEGAGEEGDDSEGTGAGGAGDAKRTA